MRFRIAARVAGAALLLAAPRARAAVRTAPDTGWTIIIEIAERRVLVVGPDGDIRQVMPAAVGSGKTLQGQERTWKFDTPTGVAVVTKKETNPLWVPPDWNYIEVAASKGLAVEKLEFGRQRALSDGRRLALQGGFVGVMIGEDFYALPTDEHVIFDNVLFIPPFGSKNRIVPGVLGKYRLLLSNGVGLHGTPYAESIGKAVTHGCIRLHDGDIRWLYDNIPVGTTVIIR